LFMKGITRAPLGEDFVISCSSRAIISSVTLLPNLVCRSRAAISDRKTCRSSKGHPNTSIPTTGMNRVVPPGTTGSPSLGALRERPAAPSASTIRTETPGREWSSSTHWGGIPRSLPFPSLSWAIIR
jgi:hypothetical protein